MARNPRPRRVLATYQDQASAQQAAFGWIVQASGVAVEHQVAGTTPDRPWAVTATRDRQRP
jgi:hypothetical protein